MKSTCWDTRATDSIIKSGQKDTEASIKMKQIFQKVEKSFQLTISPASLLSSLFTVTGPFVTNAGAFGSSLFDMESEKENLRAVLCSIQSNTSTHRTQVHPFHSMTNNLLKTQLNLMKLKSISNCFPEYLGQIVNFL